VQGLFSDVTRIDEVRKALAQVLPSATKFRRVGLITYGPGPYAHCNVELDFTPMPNAAERIMGVVNTINPAGKTPLVEAVKRAAEVLAYQGTIVLLTDGEETCGGAPCALGKAIKAAANGRLTVHVVGYQLRGFSWTGAQSILDVKCLAEEAGGLYITANNRRDLVQAFEKTLGCPWSAIGAPLRRAPVRRGLVVIPTSAEIRAALCLHPGPRLPPVTAHMIIAAARNASGSLSNSVGCAKARRAVPTSHSFRVGNDTSLPP
jgi:Ca-activated chloride channel family protein